MNKDLSYKRKPSTIGKQIGDEYIVIDTQKDRFYILNATGATIYKFLYKKRKLDEIVEKIYSLYRSSLKIISVDIKNFLTEGLDNFLDAV